MGKSKLMCVLLALAVVGCASESGLKTHYLTIDEKTLAYEVTLVSGTTHRIRIWRDGIVVLPDAVYERALQMRGAEKAMAAVCGESRHPKILAFKLRTARKAYTDLLFRCRPKPRKIRRRVRERAV